MFRVVMLLCVVVGSVKGQSTPVSRCTGENAGELPINTYLEGCTNPPCQLPRDSFAVIHIVFKAPHTLRSMETLATAFLLGSSVPYPLQEYAVTCNFLTNTYCPILAGEIVQYTLRMRIERVWPLISVPIEFLVEDENNKPIICIGLQVRVLPAESHSALNGTVADQL